MLLSAHKFFLQLQIQSKIMDLKSRVLLLSMTLYITQICYVDVYLCNYCKSHDELFVLQLFLNLRLQTQSWVQKLFLYLRNYFCISEIIFVSQITNSVLGLENNFETQKLFLNLRLQTQCWVQKIILCLGIQTQ